MSTKKYHAETFGSQHGAEKLFWPGTPEGFPVIGTNIPPNLKQEELENIEHRLDFKSKMFELWDEKQKAEFDDINDKIINNWYSLLSRSDHWDEEKKHFRVWLEWCQIYGLLPSNK